MNIDKKVKDLLYKRELRKEIVMLRKQLKKAAEALRKYSDGKNWNEYTFYDGKYAGGELAKKALSEIEEMKGKKDELYWSPDAWDRTL